jgi:hypothetical protein
MTTPLKPEQAAFLAELRQYTGDLERYRHPLNPRLIFTPGVEFLAEEAGAYWLIDAVASWLPTRTFQHAVLSDERIGELHFWTLTVADDHSAILKAVADKDEPAFIRQEIAFTDFCLPSIDLWCGFDGKHWTLYLPSEH